MTDSYDVFGNLVEQDETSGGNTVVTKFANQVKNTGGASRVWADLNASNQIQTRRVYLDTVDAVCARIGSDGSVGWYLTDHLGSIGAIMNNSGAVIDHITYDAWGNPTDSNPSAGDRYKFTGQEYDSVTGQYYDRARMYDAAVGRFTSQDPLGFAAGDANLYRYCGNAPTGATDSSGLAPITPPSESCFYSTSVLVGTGWREIHYQSRSRQLVKTADGWDVVQTPYDVWWKQQTRIYKQTVTYTGSSDQYKLDYNSYTEAVQGKASATSEVNELQSTLDDLQFLYAITLIAAGAAAAPSAGGSVAIEIAFALFILAEEEVVKSDINAAQAEVAGFQTQTTNLYTALQVLIATGQDKVSNTVTETYSVPFGTLRWGGKKQDGPSVVVKHYTSRPRNW